MILNFIIILSLTLLIDAECDSTPSTYSFTFENLKVQIINDGNIVFKDVLFDVPLASVQRAAFENRRSISPTVVGLNQLLVDTGFNRVLVDAGGANVPEFTGTCLFDKAGLSIANMEMAGISLDTIDSVLLTHGHPDHVGGLTSLDGNMTFPNATVYISRADHEFWMSDSLSEMGNRDGFIPDNRIIYRKNILPYEAAGRLFLVEKSDIPLKDIRFIPTPGHTDGHSAIEFMSAGKRLTFTGDVFRTKWDQLQHPDWRLRIDAKPNLAIESRVEFLETVGNRGDLLVSAHEHFPGLGYVSKWGPFFDWVPAHDEWTGNVTWRC